MIAMLQKLLKTWVGQVTIAVLLVFLVTLLRYSVSAYTNKGELILYPLAVLIAALYFGKWMGFFTTGLAVIVANQFALIPQDRWSMDTSDIARLASFILEGIIISFVCDARLQALRELGSTSQELTKVEKLYTNAINGIPCMVFLYIELPQKKMIWLNSRWQEFTGQEPIENDVIDHWFKMVHPEDYDVAHQAYLNFQPEKGVYEAEVRIMSREGKYRWHLIRSTPLYDETGVLQSWFGTMIDVHDRRTAESFREEVTKELELRVEERTQTLADAALKLGVANRELEAFTYSVSHDLRAPLRSIHGFSQALEEDFGEAIPAEGHDYLNRIRRAAKRMEQLIDALLMLSRISRSGMTVQELDLTQKAYDVILEIRAANPDLKVEFDVEPGMHMYGDKPLMRITMDNLIGNAVKFSERADAPKVKIHMENTEHGPALCIEDNGCGFDMQYATKLFNPFERLHNSRDFPGSGIGLASVHRIITKHGGKVWAESKPGEGAKFFFTLPPPVTGP